MERYPDRVAKVSWSCSVASVETSWDSKAREWERERGRRGFDSHDSFSSYWTINLEDQSQDAWNDRESSLGGGCLRANREKKPLARCTGAAYSSRYTHAPALPTPSAARKKRLSKPHDRQTWLCEASSSLPENRETSRQLLLQCLLYAPSLPSAQSRHILSREMLPAGENRDTRSHRIRFGTILYGLISRLSASNLESIK